MALTIELPPEREQELKAEAKARGLTVEQWVMIRLDIPQVQTGPASIAHLQKTNPKEWIRQFRAWAESHDRTTPPLSDEAVRRESIYPDRI